MDAALTTKLSASRQTAPVRVVEIDGGTYQFCDYDYYSETGGAYHGHVRDWGRLETSSVDRNYALETPVFSLTLRTSSDLNAVRIGQSVSVKVGHRECTHSQWYPAWVGIVAGKKRVSRNETALMVRRNDTPLRREIMSSWTIGTDYPSAPAAVRGLRAPVVMGRYDSSARGGSGPVTFYQVETNKWIWTAGVGQGVDRLFVKDVLQDTVNWTSGNEIRNGRTYSYVTFTYPPGDSGSEWHPNEGSNDTVVTGDVRGLTTTGTGGGTLITDPVDQLVYFLSQFCYGVWQSGAWLATHAIVDTTTFAAAKAFLAKLANGNHLGSFFLPVEKTVGKTIVDRWCKTWGIWLTWTDSGALALAFDDHTVQTYPTTWITTDDVELGGAPLPVTDPEGLIDRLDLTLPSGLTFDVYNAVADLGGIPAPGTIDMPYAQSYL